MATREEIDALLIGRLYGELGSADEARLQQHLDANPDDGTALAGLTQARATVLVGVRNSRLLEAQQDPPQSLSALLMQEAARRAPKPAATESWFARFTRSFIAHPAMAAAATLVLVVGVAGTMYMKKGSQFAKETTTTSAAQRHAESMGLAVTEAPSAAVPPVSIQVAAGSANDGVLRDDPKRGGDSLRSLDVRLADPDPAEASTATRRQGQPHGLEVTTPTVEPKDLVEDQVTQAKADRAYATKPTAKPRPAKPAEHSAVDDDDHLSYDTTPSAAPATGATVGGAASPKGSAGANAVGSKSEQRDDAEAAYKVKAAQAPVAPPSVAPSTPAPVKKDKGSSVNDRELQAAVSAAQQNQCDVADRYATSIANRDLDYYASQVEDNRELKHCKAVMKQAPRAAEMQRAQRAKQRTSSDSK